RRWYSCATARNSPGWCGRRMCARSATRSRRSTLRLASRKGKPGLLEFGGEAGAHRFDLFPGLGREIDVAHVVHPAGDDHLQNAFRVADVAERAANARREGHGVVQAEDRAARAVVVPAHLEAALHHREGLVGLPVRVQARTL